MIEWAIPKSVDYEVLLLLKMDILNIHDSIDFSSNVLKIWYRLQLIDLEKS